MEQALPRPQPASTMRKVILILGPFLLIGLLAVMAINLYDLESSQLQGSPAPDFTLTLFDQFEPDQISLSDLRGQVVVVNFWASWCVECYKEAALLEQAWQDHQAQGVVFIGVDYLDTEVEGLAYMQKYGITYPSGPDLGSKISKSYGLTGVPETIFIDKDGQIAYVQIGSIEAAQLYSLLAELVAKPAKGT
jgi:cytochrome c biogenesis protein CcmG/thiol:disulfide interchange protein DsbE